MSGKQKKPNQSLDSSLNALFSSEGSQIDSATLLSEIISQFGGTKAFVKKMVFEFNEGRKGGMSRVKFVQLITMLVQDVTRQNAAKVVNPQNMTTDQLKSEAVRLMKRLQASAEEETQDATQEPAPAATFEDDPFGGSDA